jgi:zinc D-Ala-D-Ala carboxypeptidase
MNATEIDQKPMHKQGLELEKIQAELGITQEYMKRYKVPRQPEAKEFIYVGTAPQARDIFLTPDAAKAWSRMNAAAKIDGIVLVLSHGFRSIAFQTQLIQKRLKKGEAIDFILTRVAVPGYSEHHTGNAIDVGTDDCFPPTQELAKTKAYAWLMKHAADFRFRLTYPENNAYDIIFEPWHWCYQPE